MRYVTAVVTDVESLLVSVVSCSPVNVSFNKVSFAIVFVGEEHGQGTCFRQIN